MTLEELLNLLISKGWKPFGDIDIAEFNQIENTFVAINYESKVIGQPKLRQIASIDSGLWKFVCENEMIKSKDRDRRYYNEYNHLDKACFDDNYYYWLIEASLKDESELEQFLLDNIKIDE